MFDFVSDIWGSDVVVETLGVVTDYDLRLTFTFVLTFYELFLNGIVAERLHERTELFLLVVPGRTSRIHEDGRTQDGCQDLRLLELALVDVEDDQQIEVDALVVVSRRAEFYSAEVNLPVDHLHLALPSDAHVD